MSASRTWRPLYMAAQATRRLAQQKSFMSAEASSSEPEITHEVQDGLRFLTLNRPKALNALNTSMINSMKKLVDSWETSDEVQAVILQGTGRAFCAGGDVVSVVKLAQEDDKREEAINFFKVEYDLDQQLAHLGKPAMAILNGITMGGGVGLSIHLPFRIVTENTVFSMPETTIGLFPDVGVTFFLARMDGFLGAYLGLTSERLNGYAAYHAGIGTHFIPSGNLDFVKQRLLDWSRRVLDRSTKPTTAEEIMQQACNEIDDILEEHAADASFLREYSGKQPAISGAKRKAIDHCFRHRGAEDILRSLQKIEQGESFRGEGLEEWAKQTADTIRMRSPTSVKVTLAAIRNAATDGINTVFDSDMQLAATFCTPSVAPDFVTGVTHLLINKQRDTRADWRPSRLEDVKASQVGRTWFGKDPAPGVRVPPLAIKDKTFDRPQNYMAHPFGARGLPSELLIREVVTGERKDAGTFAPTEADVLKTLQRHYRRASGKAGLAEKVHEVIERMCNKSEDGQLGWNEPARPE